MNVQTFIEATLRQHFSDPALTLSVAPAMGGDIHQSYIIDVYSESDVPEKLFAKVNSVEASSVLAAEHQALLGLQSSGVAYYPRPLLLAGDLLVKDSPYALLVMDYHELVTLSSENASKAGVCLARQHQIHQAKFGWEHDNFIGLTVQQNQWSQSWSAFFAERRLVPQLELAITKGLDSVTVRAIEATINRLADILDDSIQASLLHGDLWLGNLGFSRLKHTPLFYDPAPYFGDPEVDIAMTKLFGSLPDAFYRTYHEIFPLREGHIERAKIYDLYHALNHFNIFGSAYQNLIQSSLTVVVR